MARFTGYKKASLFRHSLDCSLQKDLSAKLPGGGGGRFFFLA